jgi:aldehyde dehydrogenase
VGCPGQGQYFDVITPITGKPTPRPPAPPQKTSNWRSTPPTPPPMPGASTSPRRARQPPAEDRRPHGSQPRLLAYAETVDNGKPIRETLNADIPLAVDHFRYFAGCVRAQEGGISEIDENTVAYHFHEPLGVVGQIIPGTSRS